MLPAYKIGKTRIKLAQILTEFCGVHVAPALLLQNYRDYRNGRNYGSANSWYYNGDQDHPFCGSGSSFTMVDFVRLVRKGWTISADMEDLILEETKE